MSVGTYEQWRSDAARFNSASLGNALDDWPGERWLDIRSQNVRNVMLSRLNTARDKGCDSIEPDNMDAYTHRTGFPLTFSQQLDYNRFLARCAHERGMSIALKNNLAQVPQLVGDFAINESCYQYNECRALAPFINQGKAVLNAEYNSHYWYYSPDFYSLSTQSASRRFSTLVLPVLLNDAFRLSCL